MSDIRPQQGFQEKALSSDADITIIGGMAGGGKTTAVIMNPIRHIDNKDFRGLFLRREFTQIAKSGGLWDASKRIYNQIRPRPDTNLYHKFTFASGAVLEYGYLTRESDWVKYDGSEYAYIAFDQLEHFDQDAFWFMFSRNRSTCGVNPYMFCSCNPQTSGWLKKLLSWYIYPDNYPDNALAGYPIPERDGAKRYLIRKNNVTYWGNTKHECLASIPSELLEGDDIGNIKSFRFITGSLEENVILNKTNPGYKASLGMLGEQEKNRLMRGCWKAYSGDAYLLVQPNYVTDAFENEYTTGDEKYLTADIALEGNDKYVIGYWEGWHLKKILTFKKTNGKQVNDKLKDIARIFGVRQSNIIFDATGVGAQTGGYLPAAYKFYSSSSPIGINNKNGGEQIGKEYINLRSQCYYLLADQFSTGDIAINADEDIQQQIILEFSGIKKMDRLDGKLAIEPKATIKARIGCSPDYADMMMMRAVKELSPTAKAIPMLSGTI